MGGEGYCRSQVTVHHHTGTEAEALEEGCSPVRPSQSVLQLRLPPSRCVRLTTKTAHHSDHGNSASQTLVFLVLEETSEGVGWGNGSVREVFLCKPDHLSVISRTHTKEKKKKKLVGVGQGILLGCRGSSG